eukprot:9810943-Alexandrium_andersonii.AAC.1
MRLLLHPARSGAPYHTLVGATLSAGPEPPGGGRARPPCGHQHLGRASCSPPLWRQSWRSLAGPWNGLETSPAGLSPGALHRLLDFLWLP